MHFSSVPFPPRAARLPALLLLALLPLAAGLRVSADKLPTWVVPTDLSSLPVTRVGGGAFFNGSAMVLTGGATAYSTRANPMAPVSDFAVGAWVRAVLNSALRHCPAPPSPFSPPP